ncbi:hypothetical protein HN51_019534 [Arachis hypogaea]|uniref:uncharacterized protein isoform X2 n=1 Tax=Arachis hypogaea TaxID=3818 RepID=UPI000DEC5AA3|nr:uncharacterized protein LOC112707105 isoform X2 [Arachis hypogaea]QHO31317.1 IST1-like protein [Arachis hypogaea]
MFDIWFGWSKASKCKRTIKRGRCRLKLIKNKREAIARQLRKDVAELIHCGHDETALNRVEQLIEDERLAAVYELLDHYCEFVLSQLSYIRRHRDCPNDINEAVSSLIYASARCGEIPELCVIRKLFGERYGDKFVTTAMELLLGNLVNNQLKENLSGNLVSEDLKLKMVDEIVRENCTQEQVLAIQYYPSWQQEQVKENKGYQVHPSETEEIERDLTCVDSSMSKPNDSCSSPKSTLIDVSAIVPAVQKYPPYILNSPLKKKTVNFTELEDYGGDIEECEFSVSKDGTFQDQTLFKFRTSGQSKRERKETQITCYESNIDRHESWSEKSSIRAYTKSKRVKRPRRRSASFESIGIMDIGYMVYYHKPWRSPSAHKHGTHRLRKDQKPSPDGISLSSYAQKRLKEKISESSQSEDGTRRRSFNMRMSGCSLDQPCQFLLYDYDDDKPKKWIKATHFHQVSVDECCDCQPFMDDLVTTNITQRPRPNQKSYSGETKHHFLGSNEIETDYSVSKGNYASSKCSNARNTTCSLTRTETEANYSRAVSMPQDRRRSCVKDKMVRTYSCPNHVHPKLPEYDDIAAKFTALKRERQESKSPATKVDNRDLESI